MKNTFKPILFSRPMVLANLDNRKTQTRRLKGLEKVNINPELWIYEGYSIKGSLKNGLDKNLYFIFSNKVTKERIDVAAIYGTDDVLWVRENLHQCGELGLEYSANLEVINEDLVPVDYGPYGGKYTFRTIPSIHMPKWASRIFLKVVSVKVERLCDLFHSDARAEGVDFVEGINRNLYYNYLTMNFGCNELYSFMTLWQSINGMESWAFNPWVWVIRYERIDKPLDFI